MKIEECYSVKELIKYKKEYGTIKISNDYKRKEIDYRNWQEEDYRIFGHILWWTILEKEEKYHSFCGEEIAILPFEFYKGVMEYSKLTTSDCFIVEKKGVYFAKICGYVRLKFTEQLNGMKDIKVYC